MVRARTKVRVMVREMVRVAMEYDLHLHFDRVAIDPLNVPALRKWCVGGHLCGGGGGVCVCECAVRFA